MKRISHPSVFVLLLFLLGYMTGQTTGTIKGVVLDEAGRPIPGAEVHVAENKPFVGHRLIQVYETDSAGQFVITELPWATYVVMAGKEGANYPDTKLAFYSNMEAPSVTLAPNIPAANVKVQLGPKGGILEIETFDTRNNKKIASATVTLRRLQHPEFYITTSAMGEKILIPSLTDIAIEVSAPGYKPWPANETDKKAAQLHLKPEETHKLRVRLEPDTNVKVETSQ